VKRSAAACQSAGPFKFQLTRRVARDSAGNLFNVMLRHLAFSGKREDTGTG